ncbi:MAG: queuosine salvage family protein [Deltaproteobacteria bacterium]|nr:queuosine salvage family protein [Deltaproteobacteria bacterium]MBW2068613.1 queuosine salvage family protein [Deltaproteobacteria bacterium]
MQEVLETTQWVVKHARDVKISPENITGFVDKYFNLFADARFGGWDKDIHFFDGMEETVRWIFVLEVLNHCFWPDPGQPRWEVPYRGRKYSGYVGLAISLKRAMEENVPITNALFLARMNYEILSTILRGAGEIPMLTERISNLREAGQVLLEKFDGDAVNLVKAADHSAVRLVHIVVKNFSSFRDQAQYAVPEGELTVFFWKRAQIFASDLWKAFSGNEWGQFYDVKNLTAFADYKVPQVLRHLEVIRYSENLAELVDNRVILQAGSRQEVEIRAATIQAVELIKLELARRNLRLSSAEIDGVLWTLGQQEEFRQKPYHLCRTIFY